MKIVRLFIDENDEKMIDALKERAATRTRTKVLLFALRKTYDIYKDE